MQFQVKGRNLEVSDAIRSYAEEKLGKLERQLTDPRVELELMLEKNPSIAENQVAEATIWTTGPVLRAREASLGHARLDRPARREARAAGDPLPHARPRSPQAARGPRERPAAETIATWRDELEPRDRQDQAVRARPDDAGARPCCSSS